MLGTILILWISGCARYSTVVNVLEQDEVIILDKGQSWPEGVVPYKGTYYSENAEQRIMHAKVKKIKNG